MPTSLAELRAPHITFSSKYSNVNVVDFAQILKESRELGFKGNLKMVEPNDGFKNTLTPRAIYFAVPQALAMLAILRDNPDTITAYLGVEDDGQNQREYPLGSGETSQAGPKVGTATRVVLNEPMGSYTVDNWYTVDTQGNVAYRGIAP